MELYFKIEKMKMSDSHVVVYPYGVRPASSVEVTLWEALQESRMTNNRLHRRCQKAEAAVLQTVEECKRQGVSLGRALANAAASMYYEELEKLRNKVEP